MPQRRVVITGMGCITPLGHGVPALWQNALASASGISRTELFDAQTFPTNFSGQVKGFCLADHIGDGGIHQEAARGAQFAVAAAQQAWRQAGLDRAAVDPERVGVYLGAGVGGPDFDNFASVLVDSWQSAGPDPSGGYLDSVKWAKLAFERMSEAHETGQEPNMPASHVAIRFGARGPNLSCLTACAASTQANGESVAAIRCGDADVMISGGCHAMVHPLGVTGFILLTALSRRNDSPQTASRPFDLTRDGFVMSEGASIIILEEYEHARRRGAPMLAEVIGYGSSSDAFRLTDTHPDGAGAAECMRKALADAGIAPDDIDYICAHGTGTRDNDRSETLAIKTVFADRARLIPVSAPKSMLGHLIAAAGTTELILCVMAIREGIVPPTANLTTPDPECDLDYVSAGPRTAPVRTVLKNSFGFGGQNNCLILRRVE